MIIYTRLQVIEIDHGKLTYIGDHSKYEEESSFYKKFLENLVTTFKILLLRKVIIIINTTIKQQTYKIVK